MSRTSEISRKYHNALSHSRSQYADLYRERAAATERFYQGLFHQLVCNFGEWFRARIQAPELGRFPMYDWRDANHTNTGQWVMMYLLSVLTRNHFAEAIGYPDPLHKADWGAKTIGRFVGETIQSSTRVLNSRPLSHTFRTTRDSGGR